MCCEGCSANVLLMTEQGGKQHLQTFNRSVSSLKLYGLRLLFFARYGQTSVLKNLKNVLLKRDDNVHAG